MAAADDEPLSLITVSDDQCGYCLESGTRCADPRQLPCGHNFCLVCLKNDYDRIKAVRCPVCRKFVSVECNLDELPMSGSEETEGFSDAHRYCDSCSSASPSERRAGIKHCAQCRLTFCDTHDKVHSGLCGNHKTTTITEWETQKPVRESMMCRDHRKYPVTTGCKVCHGLYCNVCCLNEQHKACPKSSRDNGHEFDVLESLAQKAKDEVQETLATLQLKKDELSKVEKELLKMIEVLDESRETALEEMETARKEHINELNEAIEEVNSKYNDMRELYIARMMEIQTQAEGFANQVTARQTRLDRGIEQGREIHKSLSEADVMRRKESMMSAADELHGMTVPLFDVKNSLNLIDRALPVSTDSAVEKELVDVPLKFFFKDKGLDLSQITVKDSPPKSLHFDHDVTSLGGAANVLNSNAACFGEFGESLYYLYNNGGYNRGSYYYLVKHYTCNQVSKDCSSFQINFSGSVRVCGDKLIVSNDGYTAPILSSVSLISDSFSTDKTLQDNPFENSFIRSFAVTSSQAVLCSSSPRQPKLLAWNPESEETREIVPELSGPTQVTEMTDGPGETVLLFCTEVIDQVWDFYQPDQSTPTPRNFAALVDIADGSIQWKHIIEPDKNISSQYVMYSEDFFYCLKQATDGTSNICVDIIDARTGMLPWERMLNAQFDNVDDEKSVGRGESEALYLSPKIYNTKGTCCQPKALFTCLEH